MRTHMKHMCSSEIIERVAYVSYNTTIRSFACRVSGLVYFNLCIFCAPFLFYVWRNKFSRILPVYDHSVARGAHSYFFKLTPFYTAWDH